MPLLEDWTLAPVRLTLAHPPYEKLLPPVELLSSFAEERLRTLEVE